MQSREGFRRHSQHGHALRARPEAGHRRRAAEHRIRLHIWPETPVARDRCGVEGEGQLGALGEGHVQRNRECRLVARLPVESRPVGGGEDREPDGDDEKRDRGERACGRPGEGDEREANGDRAAPRDPLAESHHRPQEASRHDRPCEADQAGEEEQQRSPAARGE